MEKIKALHNKFLTLDKKHRIAVFAVFVFLILDISVFVFLKTKGNYSQVILGFDNNFAEAENLIAVNSSACTKKLSKGAAFYKFSETQLEALKDYYNKNGSVGINVRVGIKNLNGRAFEKVQAEQKIFTYGFLYAEDFDKKGKLISKSGKILSGCDLRHFIKKSKGLSYFSNELSIEKNLSEKNLPMGIVISSEYPVKIYDFLVMPARIGYDFTGEIPFYGIPSNGGSFPPSENAFDFSGCAMVFPVENTKFSVMPVMELAFFPVTENELAEGTLKIKMNVGGDTLSIRHTKNVDSCVIQTSTLLSPFSFVDFSENGNLIKKMIMRSNADELKPVSANVVTLPLKTDPGLILSCRSSSWRCMDYEVYEWDRFPGVLFFDTIDYDVQADFFTRLAYYAEKAGFRGKILTDEQLEGLHGYNAHDYSAETLAGFFTKAEKENAHLKQKEYILLDILLTNGVIQRTQDGFKPGRGAVISISRASTAALRQSFIAHEAWHGIFFIDEGFRNAVAAVYYTVDENTMAFMKGYWASQPSLGYDPSDEYLMHNEFMAYIMQQPLRGVAKYFVHCANRGSVINHIPELCAWVRANEGITFEDAGKILDAYAYDSWGLSCGRVSLISR